jgi:hypothetical protein
LGRAADSAGEADRNRLEQQEAEAQDKAHPQIRPMTQLENAYMDLEGKLGQANAHIEALEKEPNEWQAATRHLLEHYPEDVFPPNSNTPDAKAGTFARRLLTWLLDPAERARLAALAAEEEKKP